MAKLDRTEYDKYAKKVKQRQRLTRIEIMAREIINRFLQHQARELQGNWLCDVDGSQADSRTHSNGQNSGCNALEARHVASRIQPAQSSPDILVEVADIVVNHKLDLVQLRRIRWNKNDSMVLRFENFADFD
ncbi:hypothetical protein RF11_15757 [Thelohanellus kitauei]|uniref:Uncharacterized protein n=1 Tax=Thelohanellus kitauei TaxID=669202 RepID=A0A0C2MXF7_THEKT|nr:hypothetical protein RF11_15757 [Thelohanellus kitauei]